MSGVREQEKNPGEFRTSQNWIGAAGSSLKNVRYIPPNPEDMINAMSDAGILIQTNNANRNRVFAYEDYLAILRKDT